MMAMNCNINPNTARVTPIQAKRLVFIAFGLLFARSPQVGGVLSSAPIAKKITPMISNIKPMACRFVFIQVVISNTPS